MREYRAYMIVFSILLIGYAVYDYYAPDPVNWFATYKTNDKNPFGSYILHQRSTDLFESGFETSYSTLSELDEEKSILLIADNLEVTGADLIKLFELLNQGSNIFLVGSRFNSDLLDTLGIESVTRFHALGSELLIDEQLEMRVSGSSYDYPRPLIAGYFDLDSAELWQVHASTEFGPTAISQRIGNGKLVVSTNPHIFTNFGMLYNDNYRAVEKLLTVLPRDQVHYTMFYQFGRPESTTPLRYFLSEPPLKWSLYLGLFIIAMFLIIDSRRKQRAIPVINPPANTSLEYVKTLGGLFYREGNHYKAGMRLVNHFFADIRDRFLLEPEFTEKFYANLAGKSGMELSHVVKTFELIALVRKSPRLHENKLVELTKKIDTFK